MDILLCMVQVDGDKVCDLGLRFAADIESAWGACLEQLQQAVCF